MSAMTVEEQRAIICKRVNFHFGKKMILLWNEFGI